MHVSSKPRFKAGAETIFQGGELPRWAVRTEDDLLAGLVQRIEGVEELFLSGLLALQELCVIHNQQIEVSIAILEILAPTSGNRVNELIGEFFTGDILDAHVGPQLLCIMSSRVQEVSFAQSGFSPDHQRVVRLTGIFRHCAAGRVRQTVGIAGHERIEGVPIVHVRLIILLIRIILE